MCNSRPVIGLAVFGIFTIASGSQLKNAQKAVFFPRRPYLSAFTARSAISMIASRELATAMKRPL